MQFCHLVLHLLQLVLLGPQLLGLDLQLFGLLCDFLLFGLHLLRDNKMVLHSLDPHTQRHTGQRLALNIGGIEILIRSDSPQFLYQSVSDRGLVVALEPFEE